MNTKIKTKGFTLIELMTAVAIIGILSAIVLVSVNSFRVKARDAKRLSDMAQMQAALEMYKNAYGRYPDSDMSGVGTWDTTGNGTFITALVANGFLPRDLMDPTTNDYFGNYRYYRYLAGHANCDPKGGGFYVLEVGVMETVTGVYPGSPGWSCPLRDWQLEGAWVVGKFETQ